MQNPADFSALIPLMERSAPTGTPRLTTSATLLTSTTVGPIQLGVGNTFLETGLFNLAIPSGPLYSNYGISFRDACQAVVLNVEFNETTRPTDIVLRLQNFVAHSRKPAQRGSSFQVSCCWWLGFVRGTRPLSASNPR
jgi:hypothetical protein